MNNDVRELGNKISEAMNRRIDAEACARRGTWNAGWVSIGKNTYPAKIAVDIPIHDGKKVWVQIASDGTAVIVGA